MAFSMSFDPRSIAEIAQLASFPVLLSSEVQSAMQQSGALLAQAAQDQTWQVFANPTGTLASTIMPLSQSPYEIIVSTDSPYGRRRELGFVGADSLGRTYNDPPYHYMTNALNENQQRVLQLIDQAVNNALSKLAS